MERIFQRKLTFEKELEGIKMDKCYCSSCNELLILAPAYLVEEVNLALQSTLKELKKDIFCCHCNCWINNCRCLRRSPAIMLGKIEEATKRHCMIGHKLSIAWCLNKDKLLAFINPQPIKHSQ